MHTYTRVHIHTYCSGRVFSPSGLDLGAAWTWPQGEQYVIELAQSLKKPFFKQNAKYVSMLCNVRCLCGGKCMDVCAFVWVCVCVCVRASVLVCKH
jgi:hypothetical protein